MNEEMAPTKKQNSHLMGIIGAAEKGHNLLLNTMQNINNEIAGSLQLQKYLKSRAQQLYKDCYNIIINEFHKKT